MSPLAQSINITPPQTPLSSAMDSVFCISPLDGRPGESSEIPPYNLSPASPSPLKRKETHPNTITDTFIATDISAKINALLDSDDVFTNNITNATFTKIDAVNQISQAFVIPNAKYASHYCKKTSGSSINSLYLAPPPEPSRVEPACAFYAFGSLRRGPRVGRSIPAWPLKMTHAERDMDVDAFGFAFEMDHERPTKKMSIEDSGTCHGSEDNRVVEMIMFGEELALVSSHEKEELNLAVESRSPSKKPRVEVENSGTRRGCEGNRAVRAMKFAGQLATKLELVEEMPRRNKSRCGLEFRPKRL